MPLTTLDPKTALIAIDLQVGTLGLPTVHPAAEVARRAGALAEAFRRHGLPVVLVNVNGGRATRTELNPTATRRKVPEGMAALVEDVHQRPGDHTVTKQTWGAFTGTGLDEHLRNLGVTQVVIAGISTSIGVESTARHAHELGFHVTVALDAITDTNVDAHENSVTRIFPRLGETGTTQEIIDLLAATRP